MLATEERHLSDFLFDSSSDSLEIDGSVSVACAAWLQAKSLLDGPLVESCGRELVEDTEAIVRRRRGSFVPTVQRYPSPSTIPSQTNRSPRLRSLQSLVLPC
jgi:hypothetical protein